MISEIFYNIKALFSLASPEQKKGAIICLAIIFTLSLVEMLAAGLIVAMASHITGVESADGLIALSFICVFVFAAKGGIALLDSYVQNKWVQDLILDFKQRLIERYTRMDYAYYTTMKSGRSISILYNDADIYMRMGLTAMGILLSESCVFIILMAFLLYLQPTITAVLLAMFVGLGIVFIRYLSPIFKKWGRAVQDTAEKGYEEAIRILQSYQDILIFGRAAYFIDRYMKQSLERARVTIKSSVAQILPRTGIELIFVTFFAGIVLYFSASQQDLSELTTILSAYLYAGFRMLPGLNRVLIQINTIKLSEPSIARVIDELNAPSHESIYENAPGLTFNDRIEIKNISYEYPGTSRRGGLQDVNLIIHKGEFVGIVGETGSGKSTLLHILLGLIKPQQGRVLIDGQFPPHSRQWHQKIGFVSQNFQLLDGAIADNIAFGLPPEMRDTSRIEEVIHETCLESFIQNLPEGVNTRIGERGVLISGGERQRIALARALYNNPDIIMLDEATSALDLETEASIMQTISSLRDKSLTIIAVTHRPDTLKNADRILMIEQGRVVKDIQNKKIVKL